MLLNLILVSLTTIIQETIIQGMEKHSSLDSHLGFWMRFVSNHVSFSFEKKLQEHHVGIAEWVVLKLLYDQTTLSPGILAEHIGMTRGAMSKLLNRLVRKHLIERLESIKDRRFQEIKLSEKGKKLVPKLAALADLNDKEFFGHLSKKQRNELSILLKDIVSLQNLTEIPID